MLNKENNDDIQQIKLLSNLNEVEYKENAVLTLSNQKINLESNLISTITNNNDNDINQSTSLPKSTLYLGNLNFINANQFNSKENQIKKAKLNQKLIERNFPESKETNKKLYFNSNINNFNQNTQKENLKKHIEYNTITNFPPKITFKSNNIPVDEENSDYYKFQNFTYDYSEKNHLITFQHYKFNWRKYIAHLNDIEILQAFKLEKTDQKHLILDSLNNLQENEKHSKSSFKLKTDEIIEIKLNCFISNAYLNSKIPFSIEFIAKLDFEEMDSLEKHLINFQNEILQLHSKYHERKMEIERMKDELMEENKIYSRLYYKTDFNEEFLLTRDDHYKALKNNAEEYENYNHI